MEEQKEEEEQEEEHKEEEEQEEERKNDKTPSNAKLNVGLVIDYIKEGEDWEVGKIILRAAMVRSVVNMQITGM